MLYVNINIDTCNEILFGHKKEQNFAIYNDMDLEGIIITEIRQRETNMVWYHLYVESL